MRKGQTPPYRLGVGFCVGMILVGLVVFGALAAYRKGHFSSEILNTLTDSHGRSREITDDPCKYQIYGEPVVAGEEYVKVRFICGKEKNSTQTLALTTFPLHTVEGAIAQMGRISGFAPGIVLDDSINWTCTVDGRIVTDKTMPLNKGQFLECKKQE